MSTLPTLDTLLLGDGRSVALNLADQPTCGEAIRSTRVGRGLNLRNAAAQIGIAFNTLARIERGENVRYDSMAKALRWCAVPAPVTVAACCTCFHPGVDSHFGISPGWAEEIADSRAKCPVHGRESA